jgi:hypothetical protein
MKHYCEWGPTGTQLSACRELKWLCSKILKKLVPVCSLKALGGKRCNSTHSKIWQKMDVSGQLCATAPQCPMNRRLGGSQSRFRGRLEKRKYLSPTGIRTADGPPCTCLLYCVESIVLSVTVLGWVYGILE